ncbi:Ser-Thr-rich glycosyl-phosphatidyl-inositol-anchored membrane family-domain-containing protein [Aspergillus pseudotamarii]|uniref:Ser-Thr-rich glycosyl-phosphatidyl-inositol-anchored membrane family-domain-containing protein n=1 Tax=Aspergillus pseudotamarii TaxID=132259 RepID=A0A5N6SPR2_ASPPS|nr:Ser-Thr-rich glycosyl-phosphatidyl-inositol-anchored membrane family-domain-containing protein [Aspergillus pseudotamarii]KAE8135839.1 Ser-Thr-rich glycosyl-phosphatidyl-inositol-anchored membrane family-domain-containing protein [Aspergillus pseudotamarii]
MRFFQIASIVAYAASSLAVTITSPQNGDKVDFSKPYTIKWTTVPSDPEQVNIVLKNQTSSEKEIAKDIKTSDGKYTIDKIWDIETGTGYQFNFVSNSKKNTGILAQSQIFNVTAVADPPKPCKQYFSTKITKTPSSTAPSCTRSSTSTTIKTKITSRPCIIHSTLSTSKLSPSSSRAPYSPSSSTVAPSASVNKASTATNSASSTSAAPTESTGGSAALTIPAAGSLMLSLFALAL